MNDLLVVLGSLVLIGLTIWWFFAKESTQQTAHIENGLQRATITVQGGYRPEVITLKKDLPAELVFLRKDSSSCLEEIIFPELGIQKKLSLRHKNRIDIPALKPGEYGYSCGMRMYHGKLVVK